MLPAAPLSQPAAAVRARRITRKSLPAAFADSVEALLARTTETPEDQAREARKRIATGEDRATVLAEFEAQRTREFGNPTRRMPATVTPSPGSCADSSTAARIRRLSTTS